MTRTESHRLDAVFEALVANRLVIYVGGLLVIALPTLLEAVGIGVSESLGTVLVAIALGTMILTYFGERRTGDGSEPAAGEQRTRTERTDPTYSRRTRTTVAIGLFGVALGIYVAVEGETIIGVVFVVGGLLFGQAAFGNAERNEQTDREPGR